MDKILPIVKALGLGFAGALLAVKFGYAAPGQNVAAGSFLYPKPKTSP